MKTLLLTLSGLLFSCLVYAQQPPAAVLSQSGTDNHTMASQESYYLNQGSAVRIAQAGNANNSQIEQSGWQNQLFVRQEGGSNQLFFFGSTVFLEANLWQQGSSNSLFVQNSGDDGILRAKQENSAHGSGTGNEAYIQSGGMYYYVHLEQVGIGNFSSIAQTVMGNSTNSLQQGNL